MWRVPNRDTDCGNLPTNHTRRLEIVVSFVFSLSNSFLLSFSREWSFDSKKQYQINQGSAARGRYVSKRWRSISGGVNEIGRIGYEGQESHTSFCASLDCRSESSFSYPEFSLLIWLPVTINEHKLLSTRFLTFVTVNGSANGKHSMVSAEFSKMVQQRQVLFFRNPTNHSKRIRKWIHREMWVVGSDPSIFDVHIKLHLQSHFLWFHSAAWIFTVIFERAFSSTCTLFGSILLNKKIQTTFRKSLITNLLLESTNFVFRLLYHPANWLFVSLEPFIIDGSSAFMVSKRPQFIYQICSRVAITIKLAKSRMVDAVFDLPSSFYFHRQTSHRNEFLFPLHSIRVSSARKFEIQM